MSSFKTIEWKDGKVVMIDQRRLPGEEVYVECSSYEDVAKCIKEMVIRGAPAIGVAAAMGIALGAVDSAQNKEGFFFESLKKVLEVISKTRPTAVNLFWAVKRMNGVIESNRDKSPTEISGLLVEEAKNICEEDIQICKDLGKNGSKLITTGMSVMTHCNAGGLATAGYGTALGVIRAAVKDGKGIKVIANETRPILQGARLTAWELERDGIPVTLITDSMAGYVMSKGMVDAVVVGADRIAANGDVANKIGTYSLSILAKSHRIPFYVAAPVSTIDFGCPTGDLIPIEQRDVKEVTHIGDKRIAADVDVFNPAFDITPAENVDAIITEIGVYEKPYEESLASMNE